MRKCALCDGHIPSSITVEGARKRLTNRKHCLTCVPFKSNKYDHIPRKALKGTPEGVRRRRVAQVKYVAKKRKSIRKEALLFLGGKCEICGYDRCERALEFHHLDKTTKSFSISDGMTRSWDKVKAELDKCVLLCANCHREAEDGLITDFPR